MDDINVEAAFDAVARSALRRSEQDDDLYVVSTTCQRLAEVFYMLISRAF